jgi:hypothetical protein
LFWVSVAFLAAAWIIFVILGLMLGLWAPWGQWAILVASSGAALSQGLWSDRPFHEYVIFAMGLLSLFAVAGLILTL